MSSEEQVMAQYAPFGYGLSDEQEYLQAYEDVLEKYKGRVQNDRLDPLGIVRRGRNQGLTVQLMSAPSSSAVVLIPAVEKLSLFPAWHHN